MVCTNFKREERKEYIKKNVVGDNKIKTYKKTKDKYYKSKE
jgi:hypothetical protein